MVKIDHAHFYSHVHGKIYNFALEWSRTINECTKLCRIITLVGVETIFESISRSRHEISTTPCFSRVPREDL